MSVDFFIKAVIQLKLLQLLRGQSFLMSYCSDLDIKRLRLFLRMAVFHTDMHSLLA
jgi:hypothetical protein